MKQKTRQRARHYLHYAALWPTAVLSVGLTVPTHIAHASVADPSEIVVTARRTEEAAQNVPISMTVFNEEMLSERNVTSAAGLSTYTPSLNVDSRYGADQASFAIRGFTQDLGTSASVAVYFADVVAPRAGGGQITAGNGAGPGAFFDLQNVQVLKGPQGTLSGRNTTGGVIQIVPQQPTSKLEGYLELSAGNYDMRRAQGVLNVPITDSVRARFGIDTQKREGYLKNVTNIGPDRFADIDYFAGRASVIWDISDSIENYTIGTYSKSENNGGIRGLIACNTTGTPALQGRAVLFGCGANLAAQGDNFYNVSNDYEDPISEITQWQLINTTTWDVNDSFTVKNIVSYANFVQNLEGTLYGANIHINTVGPHVFLYPTSRYPGLHTADQHTIVEELQFSGNALEDKLTWQAGYYYENSRPNDWGGILAEATADCRGTLDNTDPTTWRCTGLGGSVGRAFYKQDFTNQAVYSQATYEFTDEWRTTLGLRYTWDETQADFDRTTLVGFPNLTSYGPPAPTGVFPTGAFCSSSLANANISEPSGCLTHASQHSEAPTWLIGVDYLPTPDILAYVKYSRGYRQGSIIPASPPGLSTFDPEEVDSYEIGSKTSFYGAIPGTVNISAFYSTLKDQQLQLGFVPLISPGAGTTAIVNAGESTVKGVELETTLRLLESLTFNLAYTYMETQVDSFTMPTNVPVGWSPSGTVSEGSHLTFSPRHNVVTGLSYNLPFSAEVGLISVGAQYTFTSDQIATADGPYGTLPSRRLLNLNAGWKGIFKSPFDASLFVTNARDEEYSTWIAGLYDKLGAEYDTKGEPRMYGARVRYNF